MTNTREGESNNSCQERVRTAFFGAAVLSPLAFQSARAETGAEAVAHRSNDNVIIVTARRRAEDVQTVPILLTAVGGDTLARTYTVNLNQVTQLVPTLNYSSPNPCNTAFTIRGLGSSVVAISQANVVDNAAAIALRSYLANVPKVTVKGVEVDLSARITPRFSIRASGAFADGKYASYPNGPCPIELTGSSTTRCDLTGKALPGLPKWSGSLGGEYELPLSLAGLDGDLYLRADANAKTKVFGDATGSAYTVIGGYAIVNSSMGFRAAPGWEVSIFARNLFDRNYMQNLSVQAGNSGLVVGTPSDRRMFGITLRAHQ